MYKSHVILFTLLLSDGICEDNNSFVCDSNTKKNTVYVYFSLNPDKTVLDNFFNIFTDSPMYEFEENEWETLFENNREIPQWYWDECIPFSMWEGVTLNENERVSKLDLSPLSKYNQKFDNEESYYQMLFPGGFMKCLSLLPELEELNMRDDKHSYFGSVTLPNLKILHIGDSSNRPMWMFNGFLKKNQQLMELHIYKESDNDIISTNKEKIYHYQIVN